MASSDDSTAIEMADAFITGMDPEEMRRAADDSDWSPEERRYLHWALDLAAKEIENLVPCKRLAEFEIYPQAPELTEDVTQSCRRHVGEFLADGWVHIRPYPNVSGDVADCCFIGKDDKGSRHA